jgi:hypothetical protein
MAFESVLTMASCPIISLKSFGLYSDADEIEDLFIINKYRD